MSISPPKAGGYTVQDVASSTYKPELGPRRPVYLHESVHAIVARDVRLIPGYPPHNALQEAVANFVQICVFPKSLDRGIYAKYFAQPIDPSGGGIFKPLERLFADPVTTKEYAQLASVFAYLLEKEPALLRELAKGSASGISASDVLQKRHTSWQQVQDAWTAWGRQRFAAGGNSNAPIFPLPPELR